MSARDRASTRAMVDRWNSLLAFWKERRRGPYDKNFAEWCLEMGLSNRTGRENYWDRGETLGTIRIVYEKKQKFWEYCDSSEVENTESETPFMDYVRLREVNQVRRKMGLRPLKQLRNQS